MANDRAAASDSQGSAKSASTSSNQGPSNKPGPHNDQGSQKSSSSGAGTQKGKDNVPSTPVADKNNSGQKQGAKVPGRTPGEIDPDSNKAYGPGGGKIQGNQNTGGEKSTSQSSGAKPGTNIDDRTSEVDDTGPDRGGNVPSDNVPR